MSLCIFDPSKSTREIFTSMDTYKEIGLRLLLTAGINALAAKILGGSQKHALLVGLGSTVSALMSVIILSIRSLMWVNTEEFHIFLLTPLLLLPAAIS
ncbi:MAG: hypothetical protein KFB93_06770 [Simkaniaceae bacterium]|nr:MAG: hypothetical protein KFB93_06770 [Simkaniaceae bacterium]